MQHQIVTPHDTCLHPQASTAVVRLEQARHLNPATSPLLSVSLSLMEQSTPGTPPRAFTRASLEVQDGADVALHLRRGVPVGFGGLAGRAPGAPWEAESAHGVVVTVTSVGPTSRVLLMRCHVLMLMGALLIGA